jgi:hypothetical protein
MKTNWTVVLAAVSLAACSSAGPDEFAAFEDGSEAEEIGEISEELSWDEECGTEAPNVTLNGGGSVTSPSSYTSPGCYNGYKVNLNNYSVVYNLGSRVSYNDVPPNNAAECGRTKVGAFIWRRHAAGGTTKVLTKWATGKWEQSPLDPSISYCRVPSFRIEDHTPNFTYGNNYRIAMRAQLNTADGESYWMKKVNFSTQKLN